MSCVRDTKRNDSLLTAGQNGLKIYMENFSQLQIKYTCCVRLWLSYFMSDNKHTFGKQVPPDLALLLAFLIKTVD